MVSLARENATDAAASGHPWRDIARLSWQIARANPWATAFQLIAGLLGNARTGLYIAALGGLTQALIDGDQRRAIMWAAAWAGAGVAEMLYWPTKNYIQSSVLDHALHDIHRRVLGAAADTPLERFDEGDFFSRMQRATDELGSHIGMLYASLLDLLQVVVMFTSIMIPLWFIHPLIPVIVIGCALLPSVLEQRTALLIHDVFTGNAAGERLMRLLEASILDRHNAAELRLTGFSPYLIERWWRARRKRDDDYLEAMATRRNYTLAGTASTSLGIALAFGLVVWLLIHGDAQLGSWVAVTSGLQWGFGMFAAMPVVMRTARENSAFLGDLFLFEEAAKPDLRQPGSANPAGSVDQNRTSAGMRIEARDVSFSYPASPTPVIDDVSLAFAPGEHIAIVGENGAGKSTLVRLLTGLYLPTSGTVLQDGIDTRSSDSFALRSDIGAVFQDYVAWQMPLRDNVAFGTDGADDQPILVALDQSGLGELAASLNEGLDTWLGREFGERDLSGGQWQRVALARAFYRNARFLVMDEPTAALDPLAEQRLFERFGELAAGRTAMTISHRLGPARFADRIIVMDHGRIVETGTHDALMTARGRYASMFEAQAGWYKASSDSPREQESTPVS